LKKVKRYCRLAGSAAIERVALSLRSRATLSIDKSNQRKLKGKRSGGINYVEITPSITKGLFLEE